MSSSSTHQREGEAQETLLAKGDAVSVITPVHNGGPNFRKCLLSISDAVPSPDEFIVVANGDADGSGSLAEEFGARLIEVPSAVGPAKARNLGAKAACGDILFFVDADVTVPADAIAQIRTRFRTDPDLAALIGSYDDEPGAQDFLSQYKNLFHHYVHQQAETVASTFWGACGAIRRDVFQALGGFDERYRRPSIEDIELGYRLRQAGYRIRLCKELQVKHWKRWTARSLLHADFFDRALPWTEIILRHGEMMNDLNLRLSHRMSVAMVFGLVAALLASPWWSASLWGAGILSLSLLMLNRHLYLFFARKRGSWFALRCVPWHWLYYLCGGLAFGLATMRHVLRRIAPDNLGLRPAGRSK